MINHVDVDAAALQKLFRQGVITSAGNRVLKIYGTLGCLSGKRMKKMNRVFFSSEREATKKGYRPCAHCLNASYRTWKIAQEAG